MSKLYVEMHSVNYIHMLINSVSNNDCFLADSPGKGLGVFTNKDFKKGDFVTIYPKHVSGETQGDPSNKVFICKSNCSQGIDSFDLDNMCNRYSLRLLGSCIIAGDPKQIKDGLGHMINDGARSKNINDIGIYITISMQKENTEPVIICPQASHAWSTEPVYDCNTATVFMRATRDIRKGEELFFHYGAPYWKGDY